MPRARSCAPTWILLPCKKPGNLRQMSELSTHRSFWRHLLRAFPVFIIVTLLTLVLEHVGWLRGFETSALDTWLRLLKPIRPQFVCVVTITEEDYRTIFDGKSPLNPETVVTLIRAIADGKPAVIGVDIDTSDAEWRSLIGDVLPLSRGQIPIVWEQEASGQEEPLRTDKVLGGTEVTPKPLSGISGLFQDWDGVVRRSRRYFLTVGKNEGQKEIVDSFPWAIVKAFCERFPQASRLPSELRQAIQAEIRGDKKLERERLLNFSGNRYDFPIYSASFVRAARQAEWWKGKSPFRGKVVLLGGSYRAGRDVYVTTKGTTTGVELMAQVVESELQGRGITQFNKFLMVIFDFAAWIVLVAVYYFCRLSIALWISIVAIPLASLAGSLFAFSSLAYWMDFAPIILGVVIHQLYDHAQEYRRLLKASQNRTVTRASNVA
jgi:CHASE2 domain-containing sensor protein